MGTLLIVLGYLVAYYAAWFTATRFRALRGQSSTWSAAMGIAPVALFFLGFLSPPLWGIAMIGALVYAIVVAVKELRIRRAYLERIGVKP
jgi:uncharacterized membrane protein HdeD (DUF308 family)